MADDTATVEVWVLVDAVGDYSVGADEEAVAARYAEEVGANDSIAKRIVKVTLTVPLPRAVELVGVVSAEPTGGELRVA